MSLSYPIPSHRIASHPIYGSLHLILSVYIFASLMMNHGIDFRVMWALDFRKGEAEGKGDWKSPCVVYIASVVHLSIFRIGRLSICLYVHILSSHAASFIFDSVLHLQ